MLDTHALLWLVQGRPLRRAASDAIKKAQGDDRLFVSPITAWELGVAALKRSGRPDLGVTPSAWFRTAVRNSRAKLANITLAVSAEAASVPAVYGRGDPGDCFLIATARVHDLSLVTRDGPILALAAGHPLYVNVLEC